MPKCDFNKVAEQLIEIKLRHGCSPVNLPHIFSTLFRKNTSGELFFFFNIITLYYYRYEVFPISPDFKRRVDMFVK